MSLAEFETAIPASELPQIHACEPPELAHSTPQRSKYTEYHKYYYVFRLPRVPSSAWFGILSNPDRVTFPTRRMRLA